MSSARLLAMGWRPKKQLESGIRETYGWFVSQLADAA
jgi:nucleoside-diphosphate-sugar epimerase